MESDEFLHLLSEEESSEEQLKALHHCLKSCSKNNGPVLRVSSFGRDVVCRHCGTNRIYSEQMWKSYIQNGKRNLKFVSRNKPHETIGLHTRTPQRKKRPTDWNESRCRILSPADAMDGYSQRSGGKSRTTDRETADAQVSAHSAKKKHPCYHLEHRCLSGYRIRYQQLFPVPEKRVWRTEVFICQRECFLQVGWTCNSAHSGHSCNSNSSGNSTKRKSHYLPCEVKTNSKPIPNGFHAYFQITEKTSGYKDMIAKIKATSKPNNKVVPMALRTHVPDGGSVGKRLLHCKKVNVVTMDNPVCRIWIW